jgi:hypothetical protein
MAAARPLKDLFAELTGDDAARPEEALAAAGHGDLPAELVAEAVVSYADTAPFEVAEHLAPFVTANSGVPVDGADEPGDWAALLATAPVDDPGFDPALDGAAAGPAEPATVDGDVAFGGGATDGGEPADLDEDAPVEVTGAFDGEVYDTAPLDTAADAVDLPPALSDVDGGDDLDTDPVELDG